MHTIGTSQRHNTSDLPTPCRIEKTDDNIPHTPASRLNRGPAGGPGGAFLTVSWGV